MLTDARSVESATVSIDASIDFAVFAIPAAATAANMSVVTVVAFVDEVNNAEQPSAGLSY